MVSSAGPAGPTVRTPEKTSTPHSVTTRILRVHLRRIARTVMASTSTDEIVAERDPATSITNEFAKVPPGQLSDHPRNPSHRIEDLDDLASVREYGVLIPILVTTLQNF